MTYLLLYKHVHLYNHTYVSMMCDANPGTVNPDLLIGISPKSSSSATNATTSFLQSSDIANPDLIPPDKPWIVEITTGCHIILVGGYHPRVSNPKIRPPSFHCRQLVRGQQSSVATRRRVWPLPLLVWSMGRGRRNAEIIIKALLRDLVKGDDIINKPSTNQQT